MYGIYRKSLILSGISRSSLENEGEGSEFSFDKFGAGQSPEHGNAVMARDATLPTGDGTHTYTFGMESYVAAEEDVHLPTEDGGRDTTSLASGKQEVVVASGTNGITNGVEGVQLEIRALESFVGQEVGCSAVHGDGFVRVAPEVPANSGNRKVSALAAAAMRKYAVPRSSCFHGVTNAAYLSHMDYPRVKELAGLLYWKVKEYVAYFLPNFICFFPGKIPSFRLAMLASAVVIHLLGLSPPIKRKDGKRKARIGRVGECREEEAAAIELKRNACFRHQQLLRGMTAAIIEFVFARQIMLC
ncbi:hypothetical protein HPP92_005700 [Vanilla planifolia]|uniref:Uncharacterized protein n=1 Tax=Vanilla planifolia TaxID=51239 RepID=A0A835RI87_VANPL|nr:hypothetical protein HPP92_006019 [Vanilla planifolia]KAG0494706.1 hypothetical protein HPP92_005700 [Vanilla planifolia]